MRDHCAGRFFAQSRTKPQRVGSSAVLQLLHYSRRRRVFFPAPAASPLARAPIFLPSRSLSHEWDLRKCASYSPLSNSLSLSSLSSAIALFLSPAPHGQDRKRVAPFPQGYPYVDELKQIYIHRISALFFQRMKKPLRNEHLFLWQHLRRKNGQRVIASPPASPAV